MLYKLKVFEGDTESQINEWLKENPNIVNPILTRYPMYDKYQDGLICNQWTETCIMYTESYGSII